MLKLCHILCILYHIEYELWASFLQNIHLVGRWLGSLEKLLERCCEDSHPDYRVFMSAQPAPTHQEHMIPQVERRCIIQATHSHTVMNSATLK